MRKLYAVGYDQASRGFPWLKLPPGFDDGSVAEPARK
jgi:hypothetical protein